MSAKVAIVAGAGGALGHATTVALAAGGLTVVAVDRNEHALRELPDGVRREVADTTDPSVPTPLIDRIAGEVGPPDVLVNTIGAFRPGDALSTTPETLRLMIDVNLGTVLWLSRAVAPHMQRQGSVGGAQNVSEVMNTMRPKRRSVMPGVSAWTSHNADSTLTAWTWRQVAASTSLMVTWSNAAAQWTNTSQRSLPVSDG